MKLASPVRGGCRINALAAVTGGELTAEMGTLLFLEGTNSAHLYTVLSGWAFRYKSLPDGRRQILNFSIPSDFLGLQGTIAEEMQHSVEALTTATLVVSVGVLVALRRWWLPA